MRAARGVEVFRWVEWWGVTRAVAMVDVAGDINSLHTNDRFTNRELVVIHIRVDELALRRLVAALLEVPGGSVHGERANFTRLVLGCIEAKLCKEILNT